MTWLALQMDEPELLATARTKAQLVEEVVLFRFIAHRVERKAPGVYEYNSDLGLSRTIWVIREDQLEAHWGHDPRLSYA